MELGATIGASAELDPQRAGVLQRAMTERILRLADEAGNAAALIDATPPAGVTTWPQFARAVRAAARGLSRRGLRENDAAAVCVQDAVSHAIAVHAIRAAGANAAPLRRTATDDTGAAAASLAAQLKACRARLLITSADLAELAIEAAERSWVRQVFAFGDASGTTPFGLLLDGTTHACPGADIGTGHGTGNNATARPGLPLGRGDTVVAAPPCGAGTTYTSLLDLTLAAGATIVAAPLAGIAAAAEAYQAAAAIVPRGTPVPGLGPARVFTVG